MAENFQSLSTLGHSKPALTLGTFWMQSNIFARDHPNQLLFAPHEVCADLIPMADMETSLAVLPVFFMVASI